MDKGSASSMDPISDNLFDKLCKDLARLGLNAMGYFSASCLNSATEYLIERRASSFDPVSDNLSDRCLRHHAMFSENVSGI